MLLLVGLPGLSGCGGQEMPRGYAVHGIDVSHHNGPIDWDAVAQQGVSFAFIKITEGHTHNDSRSAFNFRAAKKAGILRGCYHFFRPEVGALPQAKHFLETYTSIQPELPPVLDIEVTHPEVDAPLLRRRVRRWLRYVKKQTGRTPIVYSNPRFIEEHLEGSVANYPLWLAHYTDGKPEPPEGYPLMFFWQYTKAGQLKGIDHPVDRNIFIGSAEDLRRLFVEDQWEKSPKKPLR